MWDTVGLEITALDAPDADLAGALVGAVGEDGVETRHADGTTIHEAWLGRLRLRATDARLTIGGGSLAKWWRGDNFHALSPADTREALDALGDILGLDVGRARVTRLDVGVVARLARDPREYFTRMGVMDGMERAQYPTSVYYQARDGSRSMALYDKTIEARRHGDTIPDDWRGANAIRVEARYMRHVAALLGRRELRASTLADKAFYHEMGASLKAATRQIRDLQTVIYMAEAINTKKARHIVGMRLLIEEMGGMEAAMAAVKGMQERGEMTRRQAYDFRRDAREAMAAETPTDEATDLLGEFKEAVDEAVDEAAG